MKGKRTRQDGNLESPRMGHPTPPPLALFLQPPRQQPLTHLEAPQLGSGAHGMSSHRDSWPSGASGDRSAVGHTSTAGDPLSSSRGARSEAPCCLPGPSAPAPSPRPGCLLCPKGPSLLPAKILSPSTTLQNSVYPSGCHFTLSLFVYVTFCNAIL